MAFEIIADTAIMKSLRRIASGGMSDVYEAQKQGCEGFEKRVAVKMMRRRLSDSEQFKELFVAEAKLVSNLVQENIVQIYQLGRAQDGAYYIIMEYVKGMPLRDFIKYHTSQGKVVPEPLAIHIASRIARGLAYAHQFADDKGKLLNIVHRDVCPNNILLNTEGQSKLADFGIARAIDNALIDNYITGKVGYMSPEQADGKTVDFRADIYSLGAVLFEMLAGKSIRAHTERVSGKRFRKLEPPWDVFKEHATQGAETIVRKMLNPDPALRYQDTAELAKDLEYHIYKDGYGPTIQTVEAYLREHFPDLYSHGKKKEEAATIDNCCGDMFFDETMMEED